ncbi:hypothetical protein [Legionella shakespearei]|uniref:Uncharacterized protein n=1 Tax=Legionella shakespearei DSM 23087 TaxID=1122169 RepID=A0A0W0ZA39_9GAMM|nr:hypothetical protein [Legionella shakespearei]KTD65638.1 hypothetical protein Lsha_0247 [Legionella shakespearei DSM 23087]
MPPKEGKKLLVIIHNLEEFTEKLLNFIADESPEGRANLIDVIESAKGQYNKPIESWLTGWFYQYTRVRGPEVDLAIKGMETFPDAYTRLQEFKALVGKGEWNESSFNHFLFDELIKRIPGYKPLTATETNPVILAARELIVKKIDSFMFQYQANLKLIEQKNEELQRTQQSAQRAVDNVLITNNLDEAKASATEKADKISFCLVFQKSLWKLSWIDNTGKAYQLEPGDELIKTLVDQNIQELTQLNPVQLKRLKKECMKARDNFLDRTQLIINPREPVTLAELSDYQFSEFLITNKINATFILRGRPNQYSLSWINTLGVVNPIALDAYPKLEQWLNAQKYPLGEELIPQLKSYLLQVNTSKNIGMAEFKKELQTCLSRAPEATDLASSPAPAKEFTGKKLDLSQFADLERCLKRGLKKDSGPEPVEEVASEPKTPVTANKLDLSKFADLDRALGSQLKVKLPTTDDTVVVAPEPVRAEPTVNKLDLGKYNNLTNFFGQKARELKTPEIQDDLGNRPAGQ